MNGGRPIANRPRDFAQELKKIPALKKTEANANCRSYISVGLLRSHHKEYPKVPMNQAV
jgi:hypothetical protein